VRLPIDNFRRPDYVPIQDFSTPSEEYEFLEAGLPPFPPGLPLMPLNSGSHKQANPLFLDETGWYYAIPEVAKRMANRRFYRGDEAGYNRALKDYGSFCVTEGTVVDPNWVSTCAAGTAFLVLKLSARLNEARRRHHGPDSARHADQSQRPASTFLSAPSLSDALPRVLGGRGRTGIGRAISENMLFEHRREPAVR